MAAAFTYLESFIDPLEKLCHTNQPHSLLDAGRSAGLVCNLFFGFACQNTEILLYTITMHPFAFMICRIRSSGNFSGFVPFFGISRFWFWSVKFSRIFRNRDVYLFSFVCANTEILEVLALIFLIWKQWNCVPLRFSLCICIFLIFPWFLRCKVRHPWNWRFSNTKSKCKLWFNFWSFGLVRHIKNDETALCFMQNMENFGKSLHSYPMK